MKEYKKPSKPSYRRKVMGDYTDAVMTLGKALARIRELEGQLVVLLQHTSTKPPKANGDKQRMDWIEEQVSEGVLNMAFDIDGGIFMDVHKVGHESRAFHGNNVRDVIDQVRCGAQGHPAVMDSRLSVVQWVFVFNDDDGMPHVTPCSTREDIERAAREWMTGDPNGECLNDWGDDMAKGVAAELLAKGSFHPEGDPPCYLFPVSPDHFVDANKMVSATNYPKIPDGWKLVPVEPTNEMCIEAQRRVAYMTVNTPYGKLCRDQYAHAWIAMLSAAPSPKGNV
jgi:hypothetical protein